MRQFSFLLFIVFFISSSPGLRSQTTYTWKGAGTGSWVTDTNWIPARTTPAANDILIISTSSSLTDVPTQTIGELSIGAGTSVVLSCSGSSTLTANNGLQNDVSLGSSAQLTLGTGLTLVSTNKVENDGVINGTGTVVIKKYVSSSVHSSETQFHLPVVFAADASPFACRLESPMRVQGDVTVNSGTAVYEWSTGVVLTVIGTLTNNGTIENGEMRFGVKVVGNAVNNGSWHNYNTEIQGTLTNYDTIDKDDFNTTTVAVKGSVVNEDTWKNSSTRFTGTGTIDGSSSFDTEITIDSLAKMTLSTSNAFHSSVTVLSGGELAIGSEQTLVVGGALTVNGTISGTGGTLELDGSDANIVLNSAVISVASLLVDDDYDHNIEGTGSLAGCSLDIDMGYLHLSNNLTLSGGTIQLDYGLLDTYGKTLTLNNSTLNLADYGTTDDYNDGPSGLIVTKGNTAIDNGGDFRIPIQINSGTTSALSEVYTPSIAPPALSKKFLSRQRPGRLAQASKLRSQKVATLSGFRRYEGDFEVKAGATLLVPSDETLELGDGVKINEASGSITIGQITTTCWTYDTTGVSFGGLGIRIHTNGSTPGTISLTRTTGTAVALGGATAVKRYFDITPSYNSELNADFIFSYAPGELNGTAESNLQLYKWNDEGGNWTNQGGVANPADHTIKLYGVNSFSRWTAAQATPTLTSLSPTSADRGSTLNVVLTGSNFANGSTTVAFSGGGITVNSVTFNSVTQVTASVTISAGSALSARDVTVSTGGGSSLLRSAFTVTGSAVPAPTLTAITPVAGEQGKTLNVALTGSNFVNGGTTVGFSGTGVTVNSVTYNSATQVTANVFVSAGASVGGRNVTVSTTGGTATLTNGFQVQYPTPVLTSVSPLTGNPGDDLYVFLNGTGFAGDLCTVTFGDGITVTSVSGSTTSLTAHIVISTSAKLGARTVTVTNPAPGSGSTAIAAAFSVVNPVPQVTGVSPASGVKGKSVTVLVNGSGYFSGITSLDFGAGISLDSVVVLNNGQIKARAVISSDAAPGSRNVSATNAGPGGGTATLSNGFTVNNPLPVVSALNPPTGGRGKTVTVTVTGTDFFTGVTSIGLGSGITPGTITVMSPTLLNAALSISRDAPLGVRDLTVSNAAPGGGSAILAGAFSVQNPAPTISAISPATVIVGQSLDVVLTGSDFFAGITAVDFGAGVTVNSSSIDAGGTHVSANITVSSTAVTGARAVTVTNAAPGGGASILAGALTIGNPAPTISSVSPAVGDKCRSHTITIIGSNFIPGVTSADFGPGVTVTSVSVTGPTSLTASITIEPNTIAAARSVSVINAGPGGGKATLPFAFNVQNAIPTITGISPAAGPRGVNSSVTVVGSNFSDGATTVDFGAGISVSSITINSQTQLTANLAVAADAAMGSRTVVVTNPAPGGGTAALAGVFEVANPVPTITNVVPANIVRGNSSDMIVTGTQFYAGATSISFGPNTTTSGLTIRSLTELQVTLSVANVATVGTRDVVVTNAAPGGGSTTLAGLFTVTHPIPTLTSVAPSSAGRGSLLNVTLTGTQFVTGVTTVSFGTDISVSNIVVKSPTEIQVSISIAPAAAAGARVVSVTNPTPGGGTATLTTGFGVTTNPATDVEGSLGVVPDQYVLKEAYPNPFNPSTRIRYGIPEDSRVELVVHNMLGNTVALLVVGERVKGLYELQWQADKLPSGVYLIRMQAQSLESSKRFLASRKVVLVK